MNPNWTIRFLRQARENSRYSKDKGLKVGAVIALEKRGSGPGAFNGLPQGVPDIEELLDDADIVAKGMKNRASLHAEENAIYFAQRDLTGHTIYVYGRKPCAHCTAVILQNGITEIIWAEHPGNPITASSWAEDAEVADWLVANSSIRCIEIPAFHLDRGQVP